MDLGNDGPAQNLDELGGEPGDQVTDEGLYLALKSKHLMDAAHSKDWHEQAKKDYDFGAGRQWDENTAKTMVTDEKRVPITFNLCLSIIKAVAGIEINSRHEIYYYPRGTDEGDVVANELLNGCSKWMGQNCDAEDEQSEAFQDTLKCGMGWTESLMDYEEEAQGKYIESAIDPCEMRWDKFARKKNLSDARRLWRTRKMSLSDARALMQSVGATDWDDSDLNASWAIGIDANDQRVDAEDRRTRPQNTPVNTDKDEVHIVHAQWYEREPYHQVANPFTGQIEEMSDAELAKLTDAAKEIGYPIQSVKQYRRSYRQAFLGGKLLWKGPGPCKAKFSWQCITGEHDKNKGTWFGLITVLRDPQMMANKWLSQATHVINTGAKGGIIAEKSAFPDIREAQRTYARPDAITVVKDGAISQNKIMAKPGPGLAAPYIQLMQYAVDSIWRVTGMNQEIMGMRDVNQPGILEQQRKQAALTILATMFDSLRRYRKNVGRVRLHFIQNHLSDGRIVRIVGDQGMKAIRLLRDKTLGEYDVIVDDAPTSPNQKEQTFAMLLQLLPTIKDKMSAEATIVFLEYSPLPREALDKFRKMLLQVDPSQQMSQKLQVDGAMAKIEDLRASTDVKHADAAQKRAVAGKTQIEGIVELAQLGVAASAEQLNNIRGAVTVAKAVHAMQPDEAMEDAALITQENTEGMQFPPQPPPLPTGPRQPGMMPPDQMAPSNLPPQQ